MNKSVGDYRGDSLFEGMSVPALNPGSGPDTGHSEGTLDTPVHLSSATVLGSLWTLDSGNSRETVREGVREGSLEGLRGD